MKLRKEQQLGERELDILQTLWRLRSATVTEVQMALREAGHEVAYTTVQTMPNRLEAKGYVVRDNTDRAHQYRPRLKEVTTVGGAVERLVNRFFGGSTEELAAHLVEKNLDADQLERLQMLIDQQRRKGRKK
jgi:predicted transcriptional regulator